jgi:transposase
MAKAEIVAAYKKLALVETAFRNLETVPLEVRPVYHKLDDRIRSHPEADQVEILRLLQVRIV